MHPERMRDRLPSARFHSIGYIEGYQLKFNKRGMDESAKCNAHPSKDPQDQLWGILYEMSLEEKAQLEIYEEGYDVIQVTYCDGAEAHRAFTYSANFDWIDDGLKPFDWYFQYVRLAVEYYPFPKIHPIECHKIKTLPDPDSKRSQREHAIIFRLKKT